MYILGSILLLIAGVVMLVFPEFVYEITESWKSYSAGEPSKLYIIHVRVGGVCFVAVGLLGLIVPLFI